MSQPKPILRQRQTAMTVAQACREVRELEGLRFLAPSRTHRHAEYLVDLDEHELNGQCGCPHFRTRLAPKIRQPGWTPGDETRCWHIMVVRAYFLEKILRAVATALEGRQ